MKTPEPLTLRANKKGQGFHLFKPPSPDAPIEDLKKHLLFGAVIAGAVLFLIFMSIAVISTPEFTMIVATTLALCGLIAWDIVGRHFWEKKVSDRLDRLYNAHDRLVREAARNRSDIAILKEGLGEMALDLEAQGRKLSPSSSTEAKMIGSLVTQLGALGDKPRAEISTKSDNSILELEMAPPPEKPAPMSELDAELNPDFSKYSDTVVGELVRHAVRNDKIELFMQPIVSLPQRKPRMHEIYTRIRAGNGTYLPAERYLDLADKEDLVPTIDNLLLMRCLQMLRERRHSDHDMPYVLNIASKTLNDRGFMGDLVAFLSQNHKMAARLIFELPQKELNEQGEAIAPVLDGLSRLGVRFSMDRVRNRRIDINTLKSCNIRFIKLDANWLLTEGHSKTGFSRIVRLKKQLDAAGIDLVVERIERETMLRELLDFNIDYGQGYLFGKPDHFAAYRENKAVA